MLIPVNESASEGEEFTREVPEKWSRRRRQKPKDDLEQLPQENETHQLNDVVVSPRPAESENASETTRIIHNPETVEVTQASGFSHATADRVQNDAGLADTHQDGSGPMETSSLDDDERPEKQPAGDDNHDRNRPQAATVTSLEAKSKAKESAAKKRYDADRKRYLQDNKERLGEGPGSLEDWVQGYSERQTEKEDKNKTKGMAPEGGADGGLASTEEPPLPPANYSRSSQDSVNFYADLRDVRKAPLPPDADDGLEEPSIEDNSTNPRTDPIHTDPSQRGHSSRPKDGNGLPPSDSRDTAGPPKFNGTASGSKREGPRQPQSEMPTDPPSSVPSADTTGTKTPADRTEQEAKQIEVRPLPEHVGDPAKHKSSEQPAQFRRKSDGTLANELGERLERERQVRAEQAGVEYPEPRENINPDTGLSRDRPAGPLTTDETLKVVASAWEQERADKSRNRTAKGTKSDKYQVHKDDIKQATQSLEDRTEAIGVNDQPEITKPGQKRSKASDQAWQAHHSDEDTDVEVEGMRSASTELTCR